jgi:sn-glycerol 3-phosphate transport system ATP-binding protein
LDRFEPGRGEQIGRPIEVYDDPASLFVAGFIGSPAMNFLPGRRVGDEVEVGEGVRVPLPAELRAKAGEGVTVGVRPEHLITTGGAGPVLDLKVDTVEALGADSLLHCALGGAAIVVRVDGHDTPEAGATLAVQAMPGKTYFFDTASGKRL